MGHHFEPLGEQVLQHGTKARPGGASWDFGVEVEVHSVHPTGCDDLEALYVMGEGHQVDEGHVFALKETWGIGSRASTDAAPVGSDTRRRRLNGCEFDTGFLLRAKDSH